MTGSSKLRPLRVYVSHSFGDDAREVVQSLRELGHEPHMRAEVTSWKSPLAAITDTIRQSDLFVAVGHASPHVLVELGAASAIGIPILIVSEGMEWPLLASELQFVRTPTRATLASAIRRATAKAKVRDKTSGPQRSVNEGADQIAGELLSDIPIHAARAEELIANLFTVAGARVVRPAPHLEGPPTSAPDMVVWHDDLHAGFGLPLPVEVLWGRGTRTIAILNRLRYTLTAAGTRSLVGVLREDQPALSEVANDGRLILLVSVRDLVTRVRQQPLAEALAQLLTQAEPHLP